MSDFSEDARNIERLLRSLEPRASRINRDRLMFLAGEASVLASRRTRFTGYRVWAWPAATVCSVCLGLGIGVFISRPSDRENRRVAHAPTAPSDSSTGKRSSFSKETASASTAQQPRADQPVPTSGDALNLFALRNRMLANIRDDPGDFGDALRLSETAGVGPDPPCTYGELMRRMLDEKI